jgi:hypothetical protein
VQVGSLVNVAEYHFSKIKKDFVTRRPVPCFIVLLKLLGSTASVRTKYCTETECRVVSSA